MRRWKKWIKVNGRYIEGNKTTSAMLHVKFGKQVDPGCLEMGDMEGRKRCCDQSTNNNGRSTYEIEIRGQLYITRW